MKMRKKVKFDSFIQNKNNTISKKIGFFNFLKSMRK